MTIHSMKSTSVEKVPVVITTTADPTTAAPSFALTATTVGATTSSYVEGEWVGTWNATTGDISALTPLTGDGQVLDVDPDTDYRIHAKWTVLTEVPDEDVVGLLRVGS